MSAVIVGEADKQTTPEKSSNFIYKIRKEKHASEWSHGLQQI